MSTDPAPHSPRELTNREWRVLDTYEFKSPKLDGRIVAVVEPARLALALELEFDPDVVQYVERPRTLSTHEGQVELCFWHRTRSGAEHYDVLTSNKEATVHAVRRAERRTAQIAEAAETAGIRLRIRKTNYCLPHRIANSTHLQLLPYVQAAMALPNGHALEQAICEHLKATPRTTFYSIERSLSAFRSHEVRAQVCALIHRGDLQIDFNARLNVGNPVWAPGAFS